MKNFEKKHKYLFLFFLFAKLGIFSIGGGASTIMLLHDELVIKKHIIKEDELTEMIAISESTPGPIAVNLATYLGFKQAGFKGSVMATLGITMPTFLIMFFISLFLKNLLSYEIVKYAFMGIKCAVIFLILRTGIKLIKGLKNNKLASIIFALCTIAMICITIFSINFSSIFLILIGAVIGVISYGIILARKITKK